MGDVNLEIKLNNLDERVTELEDSGGGGGESYISSVSTDFNVVNKKLSLSNLIIRKLSKLDENGQIDYINVKNVPNLDNYALKTDLDSTVKTSTVDSDGKTVTFTNIDTSKCYKPYANVGTSFTDKKPVGMESMTLNGTTLTYVLTNASAGMEIVLREIKL